MKPKVFVARPFQAAVLDFLALHCELRVHREDVAPDSAQLAEACRDVEGLIVTGADPVPGEVVRQAPRLRVISNVGVGYDNIAVAACTERGIVVTYTPGLLTETTADHTFALLLAVARRLIEGDRYVREGRWQRWQWGLLWGAEIHHKTLGLYGFGRIGQAVARRGRGFAMRILYHDLLRVREDVERELGAEYADRLTLLRESDFLSLHVPLTPETHHLIGARELGLMKSSAFLINTSRGKVVEEEALVAALQAKTIAGAALDVFEQEPRVHPELLKMPQVVLSPHIASASAETRLKIALQATENLLAALAGRRPSDVVNPEVFR